MNQTELKNLIKAYRDSGITEFLQAFLALCQYLAFYVPGFQCPWSSQSTESLTREGADGYVDAWEQEYVTE